MSRVFVLNRPPGIDLEAARLFGSVRLVLGEGRPPPDPMESVRLIEHEFKVFTKDDFIALVGEMDLVAIGAAFAMEATGGIVRFLKWDRNNRAYYPLEVTLPQLFEDTFAEEDDGPVEDPTHGEL